MEEGVAVTLHRLPSPCRGPTVGLGVDFPSAGEQAGGRQPRALGGYGHPREDPCPARSGFRL